MITSSSIQYITRMLNEPTSLTDMDKESVAAIIKEFPYFVPARYMDAAIAQNKRPGSNDGMDAMWLYMGNWLLFNELVCAVTVAEEEKVPERRTDRIKFSLATVESEPEPPVIVAAAKTEEELPKVQAAVHEEQAPEGVHLAEVKKEEVPQAEEHEDIATQIVHREEAVHEEEVYKEEIIKPLFVKEDIIKEETLRYEDNEENDDDTSMYVDDSEEHDEGDDLIIKPLNYTIEHFDFNKEQITDQAGDTLILPVYTENYFFHQGIKVSEDIPEEMDQINKPKVAVETEEDARDRSLMVMMSFSEWLQHFKTKTQKEQEESADKSALKSMWQQEKLAAANEEENEEIPEEVFNMAVNSITKEEDLASEALAQIHRKQGKYDRAIDMYRKLSLRNPQKIAYFAHKIEELLKEKEL